MGPLPAASGTPRATAATPGAAPRRTDGFDPLVAAGATQAARPVDHAFIGALRGVGPTNIQRAMRSVSTLSAVAQELRTLPKDDEAARTAAAAVLRNCLAQLTEAMGPELMKELADVLPPPEEGRIPSSGELSVAYGTVVGSVNGLLQQCLGVMKADAMVAGGAPVGAPVPAPASNTGQYL